MKIHAEEMSESETAFMLEQGRIGINKTGHQLGIENILGTEYLPGRYTDLTWLKHKHSLHCAPNHESLDFFRGFHLSELGMDILNTLQVKSSEKV